MDRLRNAHIEGIQNEYRRINAKWLQMQYRMLIWLALFTAIAETVMFFVLDRIDAITHQQQHLSCQISAGPIRLQPGDLWDSGAVYAGAVA